MNRIRYLKRRPIGNTQSITVILAYYPILNKCAQIDIIFDVFLWSPFVILIYKSITMIRLFKHCTLIKYFVS